MHCTELTIAYLRLCMALLAALAMAVGVSLAWQGHVAIALAHFCGTLFFLFAYFNPAALSDAGTSETGPLPVRYKRFLWASLLIGMLAVSWEFRVLLPLG